MKRKANFFFRPSPSRVQKDEQESKAKKSRIIFAFAFLCLFLQGVLLAISIVLLWVNHDWTWIYPVQAFLIASTTIITALLFLFYRRTMKELDSVSQNISDQLTSFRAGSIRLGRNAWKSAAIRLMQNRVNEAVSHFNEVLAKNEEEESKKSSPTKELLTVDEFASMLSAEVLNNPSYRSCILAIRAEGKTEAIPPEVNSRLYSSIRNSFPGVMIGKDYDGTYLCYVYRIEDKISLQSKIEAFVSSFAVAITKKNSPRMDVYGCSVGGAVYPLVPSSALISTAKSALHKGRGVNISYGDGKVYSPSLQNENTRRIIALNAIEACTGKIMASKTAPELHEALAEIFRLYEGMIGFDVGGAYLYHNVSDDYELILEQSRSGDVKGFSSLGKRIPAYILDPFYEASVKDFPYVCSSPLSLPRNMLGTLSSIGMKTVYISPIAWQNTKYGFVYLLGKESIEIPLLHREKLHEFAPLLASSTLHLALNERSGAYYNVLNAFATHSSKYFYMIDRASYRLTRISDSLHQKMPGVQPGQLCHKAIYGEDSPCQWCPLTHGVSKRVIPSLSMKESTISSLGENADIEGFTTILLEQETASSELSSSLIDKNLLIRNSKALSIDLSHEIKANGKGYLLSIRLINKDEIVERSSSLSANAMMTSIVKAIQGAGYDDLIYRYDGLTLVLKLTGFTSKTELYTAVEEVAEQIQGPLYAGNEAFSPRYSYSAIAYPNEAPTSFEAISLIKTELERSASLGQGRLVEVGRTRARCAFRDDYIADLLADSVKTGRSTLHLTPIIDSATKKPAFIEFRIAYEGEGHQKIHTAEWHRVAEAQGLSAAIDYIGLREVAAFYKENRDSLLRDFNIHSLALDISGFTYLDHDFPSKLRSIIEESKIPSGTLALTMSAEFANENAEMLEKLLPSLKDLGIYWCVRSYSMGICPLSRFKNLGLTYVKTTSGLIQDATSSESDSLSYIKLVGELQELKLLGAANGISSEEEAKYATNVGIKYLQGSLYGENMTIQNFMSFLSYQR